MNWLRRIHLPALLTLLAGLPGCVVPVGPQWTDPQSNYPPTLYSAIPPVGSVLHPALDAGASLEVEVGLADQNTKDQLYVRFIIDYPPFESGVTRLALEHIFPGGSQIERPMIPYAPNCIDDQIAHGFSTHQLLLAASDRPFASDDPTQAMPDEVQQAGNFLLEAAWQFELDCQ